MIIAAASIPLAQTVLLCGPAPELCRRLFPPNVLLRITLEDIAPWILLWIAIAGVTRLFAGPSSDEREASSHDDNWEDHDED
jgi:hypothetical protein